MTHQKTIENLQSLLKELVALPKETEWAEFKLNAINLEGLGEYISALLLKPLAYLV